MIRLITWLLTRVLDSFSCSYLSDWADEEQSDYYMIYLAELDCGDGLA
jgi:hypothetical protein